MPRYPVRGELTAITYKHNAINVEWRIPYFFKITEYEDDIWDSPSFLLLNAEWCLRITLKVDGRPRYYRHWNLVVRNPPSSYSVNFTLGIKNLSEPFKYGPVTRIFDSNNSVHGPSKFFLTENLKRADTSDESLVIYCFARNSSFRGNSRRSLTNSTNGICRNFQDLLLSGRKSDVTIVVRGQEFKAHKLILETRSPVFAAMFEHDMTEKQENVVIVEDCDPDIFQNFLQAVYAGSVENLSVEKAIPLYMVSHKYTVTDIVDECTQLMELEMSANTVFDILALANKYNETSLKKSAEKFIAKNISTIFSTNNWSSLMDDNAFLQKYS